MRTRKLLQRQSELAAEEKKLRQEARVLYDGARASGGKLSEDARKRDDEIKARLEEIETEKTSVAADLENERRLQDLERTAPASETALLSDVEDAVAKDPKKGFRDHREFLLAVIDHGRGRRTDKRLLRLTPPREAAVGSDEQSIASNPYGGFLVPEGIFPGLLSRAPEVDPFADVTKIPMAVPTLNLTARVDANHSSSVSGGLTVSRRPETVIAAASRQTYEKIQLNATALSGLNYSSEELLQYSPISIAALLQAGFSDEFLAKRIDEKINGSGAGEPEGFMNSPALITISKEAGQVADTIVYDNILKMRARNWGYGSAIWVANHDTLPTLARMTIVVGIGGAPVFIPNTTPATLLGRPIFFTEYMDKVGDLGDIALVNPTQILEGTLQPLQSAESMHVRFEYRERTFLFWEMFDSKCWWRAALTPKNSSPTLSPYVTLAERA